MDQIWEYFVGKMIKIYFGNWESVECYPKKVVRFDNMPFLEVKDEEGKQLVNCALIQRIDIL